MMARIRSIHPDACDSEKLSQLSDSAERTFFRLLTHADDEGRGEDRPKLIAAKLYPLHDGKDADTINADLEELVAIRLLVRYGVAGKRYFVIPTFKDWQKPRHPTGSKLPGPDEADDIPTDKRGSVTAERGNGTDKRDEPFHGVGGGVGGGDGHGGNVPPIKPAPDQTLAETLADWIINTKNGEPPGTGHLIDDYRWIADALERHPDRGSATHQAARTRLAQEFLRRATGDEIHPSEVKQLNALVLTTEHVGSVMRWLNEAVRRGAGTDPEHASPRARIKYAVAVSNGERGAA